MLSRSYLFFFFFNDTATTEIYTLSLHDALPIFRGGRAALRARDSRTPGAIPRGAGRDVAARRARRRHRPRRSEEHTSELQSPCNLVCRLLLEKKKLTIYSIACFHFTLPHTVPPL